MPFPPGILPVVTRLSILNDAVYEIALQMWKFYLAVDDLLSVLYDILKSISFAEIVLYDCLKHGFL
jgi:hypothetical protein